MKLFCILRFPISIVKYYNITFSEQKVLNLEMDFPELKILLSSSESKNILKALIEIRTRVVKSLSGMQSLLHHNFVSNLVILLNRSNSKIIDISLSILANLLQEEMARQQLRSAGGLAKLMNIVENIEDSNILCR